MEIKVVGICGSPVKGGNTEVFLNESLKVSREMGGVNTEMIPLSSKKIEGCRHCNWCLTKQEEGKPCAIKDDMVEIYPKLLEADVLFLATPVYFTRLSGYLATFIDRLRCVVMGKYYHRALTNKVGGALTVVWRRNMGPETTLLSIVSGFMGTGVLMVTPVEGVSQFGAVGMTSDNGTGKFDPKDRLGVLKDEIGIRSARDLGRRAVEVARIVRAGQEALK